jgi:hypothetical protein
MLVVRLGYVRMVRRSLVCARFVMPSSFPVVPCRMFVVLGCFVMMLRCLL